MKAKFEVLWSKESKRQLEKIVAYLRREWTDKEVDNFIRKLKAFEKVVSEYPEIYAETKSGLRRAVLSKHNSVIYLFDVKRSTVRVYTIFDNRQHPDKLP